MQPGRDVPDIFPPEDRLIVEQLACISPSVCGYEMTCWSARTLSTVIHDMGGGGMHFTTVATLLRTVDIQLQQMQYCKTAVWDHEAIERAVHVLWCYEMTEVLAARGEVILCVDEKPNIQILNHSPSRWLTAGRRKQQEFEYTRCGTANLLVGHVVHSGRLLGEILPSNAGVHFRPAFQRMIQALPRAKKIHVIMDNGSSHIAAKTLQLFEELKPRVRILFIPPHSSWLNKAELAIGAFSRRYLKHATTPHRDTFIDRIGRALPEFNRLHAHPFKWSFTRARFRDWLARRHGIVA